MRRYALFAYLAMFCLIGSAALAAPFTISVNQFVEHPLLDAVLKKAFRTGCGPRAWTPHSVHTAQANMATANQIASLIAGEKPDLVLAIATPSAQACALAAKKSPVLG